jgi:hypothetical protein
MSDSGSLPGQVAPPAAAARRIASAGLPPREWRGLLQWLRDWLQETGKIAPGDLELVQATRAGRTV